jgi:hypothetical protein
MQGSQFLELLVPDFCKGVFCSITHYNAGVQIDWAQNYSAIVSNGHGLHEPVTRPSVLVA